MIEIEDIHGKLFSIINDKDKIKESYTYTYNEIKKLFEYHIITDKYYILTDELGKNIYTNLYDMRNSITRNDIILKKLTIKFLPYNKNCVSQIKLINPLYKFPNKQLGMDKLFVLFAVNTDGKYYSSQNISQELLDDEEIIINAALSNKNKWICLGKISKKYSYNKIFMSYFINLEGTNIQYASKELQNDEELCHNAIKNNYNSFKYISLRLRYRKDIILECINNLKLTDLNNPKNKFNNISSYISDFYKNDKDIMLPLIEINGDKLSVIPKTSPLLKDKDIVYCAIKNRPHMYIHADFILMTDKNFILLCLKKFKYRDINKDENEEKYNYTKNTVEYYYKEKYHNFLSYVPIEFLDDKEIVLSAIKINEKNYKYASDRLKKDKDISTESINQIALYSKYDSHDIIENLLQNGNHIIKDNKIIMLKMALLNSSYIKYFSKRLKKDKDIIIACLNSKYESESTENKDKENILIKLHQNFPILLKDDDVIIAALKNNINYLKYFPESVQQDKHIIILALSYGEEYNKNKIFLNNFSIHLQDDKNIVLLAISKNSQNIKYASNRLKNDIDCVISAINNYNYINFSNNFNYKLLENNTLMYCYINTYFENLQIYNNDIGVIIGNLNDNKEVIIASIKKCGANIKHASDKLKNNKDIIFEVIKYYNNFYEEILKLKKPITKYFNLFPNRNEGINIILNDKKFLNPNNHDILKLLIENKKYV